MSFKHALRSFIEFTLTIFHVYLHYFCQRWAKFYSRLNIYFRFEQEVMGPYDNTTNKTFFHGITRISIVLPYNYLGQWFREIFYITAFHYWYLFHPIEKLEKGNSSYIRKLSSHSRDSMKTRSFIITHLIHWYLGQHSPFSCLSYTSQSKNY